MIVKVFTNKALIINSLSCNVLNFCLIASIFFILMLLSKDLNLYLAHNYT